MEAKAMNKKMRAILVTALQIGEPVKGMHDGRGVFHGEHCLQTCRDSWLADVRNIANGLRRVYPKFDSAKFVSDVKGGVKN